MTNGLRSLTLDLLKQETARDKQRLIGPSSLGTPCDYCLARGMLEGASEEDVEPEDRPYWLGAVLGTATHMLLETRTPEGMSAERRVTIGEIPGYGVVTGSSDLYVPKWHEIVDWKTTNREKLKNLKLAFDTKYSVYDPEPLVRARFVAKKYIGQIMSYGRGWVLDGYRVDKVGFSFICRDGLTDNDVWCKELSYDPAYADQVWARANKIWQSLEAGRTLESFLSKTGCYSCMTTSEPRKFSKKPF